MIAFVQADVAVESSVTQQVVNLTVTDGNMLFIDALGITGGGTSLTPTITDNQGNTYVPILNSSAGNFYYVPNANGGATRITATFSSTVLVSHLAVYEYSGVNTLDGYKIGNTVTSSGTTTVTADAPTTQADTLVLSQMNWNLITYTFDTDYTLANNTYNGSSFVRNAYQILNSIQTPSSTTTATVTIGFFYRDAIFYFNYVEPTRGVKIRGKCKIRGNCKIR